MVIRKDQSAIRNYWRDLGLGIKSTLVGMRLTGRYMARSVFLNDKYTVLYPEQRTVVPPGHRGIHGYDEDLCISCDMCASACPVDCIYIQSVGKGNDALMTQFDIDYTKCLFCDLCTPPCPTECIWMTQEFDLASYTKEDCIVNFARTKSEEEQEAHKVKLEEIQAEKKRKAAEKKAAAEAEAKAGEPAEGEAKGADKAASAATQGAAETEGKAEGAAQTEVNPAQAEKEFKASAEENVEEPDDAPPKDAEK